MKRWIEIGTERDVVLTGVQVSAVVGTILVAINYGDRILAGQVLSSDYPKMVLTYFVPYCVSTYSCIRTRLRDETGDER